MQDSNWPMQSTLRERIIGDESYSMNLTFDLRTFLWFLERELARIKLEIKREKSCDFWVAYVQYFWVAYELFKVFFERDGGEAYP